MSVGFFARTIAALGLIGALACSPTGRGAGSAAGESPAPRSVVLISIDTLRPDFLGAYRPEREGTPAIDRLASEGIVFEDVLAQGASTAISHKSILYSLYPAVHKTTIRTVPTESLTAPVEALRASGLRTGAFVDGGQLHPRYGFGTGFERYESHGDGERSLDDLAALARGWLAAHRDEPFLLFLHTYQVHAPYDPPAELRERFAGWYEGDLDPAARRARTSTTRRS